MGWFRIDDRADDSPKLLRLSDGAFRLWVMGGIHCSRHHTDGALSSVAVGGLRNYTKKRVEELVTCGLWESAQSGYVMHDFLDWNLSKSELESKRVNGRARVQKHRNALRNAHAANGVERSGSDDPTIQNAEGVQGEPTGDQREHGDRRIAPRRAGDFGRIFLHRWQLDSLIATLGEHADAFGLDEWLDALNTRIAGKALPPDPWKFVKAELHAEIARRGLAVVVDPATTPTNKRIAGLVAGGEAFLRREAEKRARGVS